MKNVPKYKPGAKTIKVEVQDRNGKVESATIHKDGKTYVFHPIYNNQGRIAGVVCDDSVSAFLMKSICPLSLAYAYRS